MMSMSEVFFVDSICRRRETTHCLVVYVGSGIPFEKCDTDVAGRRVKGVKLQGDGGGNKTSARGEEGIGKDI
jgi:hypothetical protein